MTRKHLCRHCGVSQSQSLLGARRSFAIPGAQPHYAPDLPFRLEHILLDSTIDPQAKKLEGTATQKLKTVAPGQKWIRLDQIGLKIEEVKVGGKKADFATKVTH